jgi:GNAT superfamily N-acetyltransferase
VTDIDIRAAIPSDAERLFRIQRAASLAAFAHVFPPERYPFPDAAIRSEWEARLVDGVTETLIAQRYGRPVGYVSYAPELLVSLFVDPDVQGSGIGSALHDLALAAQADLGAAACRLWVLEENQVARSFYERRGWSADGRLRAAHFAPYPRELGYSIDVKPS